MRKIIRILLAAVICLLMLFPMTASAKNYAINDTDISVEVDDSLWYVFTRDNIKDNPELAELELSYQEIYDILYDNYAYMDAILFYEEGGYIEMFIRKKELDSGMVNLSNYSDESVLDLAKDIAKNQKIENYSVYKNDYKFARLEGKDKELGLYICEFITVVNKENYTISFQATSEFSVYELLEMKNIVDSIKFDVDTSLKEGGSQSDGGSYSILYSALIGAAGGGIGGAIISRINKKKKKAAQSTAESENTAEPTNVAELVNTAEPVENIHDQGEN